MKRFGLVLALLVLFGTLAVGTGTVRAGTVDYCAYVSLQYDTVNAILSNATWEEYAPVITNITQVGNETRVCFASEKDLARFLIPADLKSTYAIDPQYISTYERYNVTLVRQTAESASNRDSTAYFKLFDAYFTKTIYFAGYQVTGYTTLHAFRVTNGGNSYTLRDDDLWIYLEAVPTSLSVDIQDNWGTNSQFHFWLVAPESAGLTVNVTSDGYIADTYVTSVRPFSAIFHLKDALTGQPLSGVTVKEGDTTLGTLDDGGTLELAKGTHTLTFEKSGYWSVTKTIDVQGDTTVSVEMYPSSAAFKLENFPADISIPENTIYELTFTLSPIQTSATYNTYLSLSGLSDVIEVRKDGSLVSPENGKYYLGDVSGPTQVSIKFKVGSVGTHGFTISIESHDAIMSKTYTTTKQVTYQVEPLPFSIQMPSEWQVGENSLRISESSGQSYLITTVLKDSSGNEVWSDSYAFSPYEAHTFAITVPSEGSYTLELQWNGQTAVYSIQVNPAITLVTKTLTVSEGGEGTIVLHFKNPSSDVQYYTIVVSGGFLPAEINQSISVAPLSEKDVSIAFAVPEDLTYDAYELQVQVYQGDAVVFQDKVAVSISDSSGFTLFGGGPNTSVWAYALVGLLLVGGLVWALRRRR